MQKIAICFFKTSISIITILVLSACSTVPETNYTINKEKELVLKFDNLNKENGKLKHRLSKLNIFIGFPYHPPTRLWVLTYKNTEYLNNNSFIIDPDKLSEPDVPNWGYWDGKPPKNKPPKENLNCGTFFISGDIETVNSNENIVDSKHFSDWIKISNEINGHKTVNKIED